MVQRTVDLDDEDARLLEQLAAAEGRDVEDLVRDAVHRFLAERRATGMPWQERFEALVTRIQSRVPPEITPEEIEADARAARAEVREARRARAVMRVP